MFLHQGANHAYQKQWLQNINMHVMASQNDILVSRKNQIDQSIYLPEELKLIGTSSILAWGKCPVAYQPLFYSHSCAKLITFQCIQVTDDNVAERFWSAITRGWNSRLKGLSTGSPPFHCLTIFHPLPKREPVHSRLPNEKLEAQILIGKHVFECFTIRNEKEDKKYIDVDQNICLCACNYHYL